MYLRFALNDEANLQRLLERLRKGNHADVEQHALLTFPSAKVNASALVNGADVFDDWLVHALHGLEPSLGTYKFGNLTQEAKDTSKLFKQFPATHRLIKAVHAWRYSSPYSHPQEEKSKTPTKPLPFRIIGQVRRLYVASLGPLLSTRLWTSLYRLRPTGMGECRVSGFSAAKMAHFSDDGTVAKVGRPEFVMDRPGPPRQRVAMSDPRRAPASLPGSSWRSPYQCSGAPSTFRWGRA
jgi:hypothetical protein